MAVIQIAAVYSFAHILWHRIVNFSTIVLQCIEKHTRLWYNIIKPLATINTYSLWWFITADKILISIRRTAMIIWTIKIIKIAGIIFTKRICLSHR